MSEVFQARFTVIGEAGSFDAFHPPQLGDRTLEQAIGEATSWRVMPDVRVQLTKGAVRLKNPKGEKYDGSPIGFLDVRTVFFGYPGDESQSAVIKYSQRLQVDPKIGTVRIARRPTP